MNTNITELENGNYKITCNIHTNYEKVILRGHKTTQNFCALCRKELRNVKYANKFVAKAKELYFETYNYDKSLYINNSTPIDIFCNKHFLMFKQRPSDHLAGKTGCPECIFNKKSFLQLKPFKEFKLQAKEVHLDRFEYIDENYTGNHKKISIKCKLHNHVFTQTPAHHLEGKNGCELCKNKGKRWSKEDFIKAFNHKPCRFYIIKCTKEDEVFYKIGITSKTIRQRYNKYNLPYSYEVLYEYINTAEKVWLLEHELKQTLKPYCYKPNLAFKGSSTETFKLSIDVLNVFKTLDTCFFQEITKISNNKLFVTT